MMERVESPQSFCCRFIGATDADLISGLGAATFNPVKSKRNPGICFVRSSGLLKQRNVSVGCSVFISESLGFTFYFLSLMNECMTFFLQNSRVSLIPL